MGTKAYRTKTELIERNNGNIEGKWLTALDIGYSAVKVFSPNKIACFPSYARRVNSDFQFASNPPESSILYKDVMGEMWLVGEVAQNTIATGDTSDSESSLYGRNRYTNPMFKVIARTGLGISYLSNNIYSNNIDGENVIQTNINKKSIIQTGLPERYMNDEDDIRESLSGNHVFSLKIGSGDWVDFVIRTEPDDIYVMSQPKGTLFSVCINRNGTFHPDAEKYLSSSILVFDPGFGTLDLFPLHEGVVGYGETYSDLGMKRVLQETSKLIKEKYNVNVPVPSMQKYLQTGLIKYFNQKTFESCEYPFSNLLKEASDMVCNEAVNRIGSSINLIDYDYMIVTGGTGEAWINNIRDKFKKFDTLKIINGNQNDSLPFIYSNVRGYYLYRFNKLGAENFS